MTEFTVGQLVWVVPKHARPYADTVEKIGRRWVTLSNRRARFDAIEMRIDGGENTWSGQVFLTMEEWEQMNKLNEAWSVLRKTMPLTKPRGMTLAKIEEIQKLLGEGE
jgi:hypothetical protein